MANRKIEIRPLIEADIPLLVTDFAAVNWTKPASTFINYIAEQQQGNRNLWIADVDGKLICIRGITY